MIRNGTMRRWGWMGCLLAVLCGCGMGCHPAASGTGAVPATSKPNKQPDQDHPGKQPKPDVGRLPRPYGPPFARAV
jgi:hypothetical protein